MEGGIGGKLRCVIVAVDGSEESMHALRWALHNLKLRGAGAAATSTNDSGESSGGDGSSAELAGHLVILHVQSPPNIAAGLNPVPIPFGGSNYVDVPAFTAAIEAHQRKISEAVISHALKICAEKDKNVKVKTEVVIGEPKESICEAASNLQADVLVMGSHAYGPLKRLFLGSVSNFCVNHAKCPVIVVKQPS